LNRKLSTLVFDLDGTLLDSMPVLADIFCDVLAGQRGVPPEFSRRIYYELAGMGPESQFRAVLRRGHLYEKGVGQLTQEFWRLAESIAPAPFPEVPRVLETLKTAGYALFVSSGGRPDFANTRAERAGIDGFFRLILGTDDNEPNMAKGAPHFRIIRESLDLPDADFRASTAMIGDGPFDMQVGKIAGLTAIGRLTGDNAQQLREAGAEFIIADLEDLLRFLDTDRD
jgi:phosphoglycolate phosphatase-like HAD superfamily hydrolase